MATTSPPIEVKSSVSATTSHTTLRSMQFTEALTGLLFVAPVVIISFVFELFPVIYGFYISLQGGINVPEGFIGLEHYVRSVGSLAFVVAVVIAGIFTFAGYNALQRGQKLMAEGHGSFWSYLWIGLLAGSSTLVGVSVLFRLGITYALPPFIILGLAIFGYSLLNARSPKTGNLQMRYVLNSWGVGLFSISAIALFLFALSELYRIASPVLLTLQTIAPSKASLVRPLDEQILVMVASFLVALLAISTHKRLKTIDTYEQEGQAFLLSVVRNGLIVAFIALTVLLMVAQAGIHEALNEVNKLSSADLRQLTRFRIADFTNYVTLFEQLYLMMLGTGLIGLAFSIWRGAMRAETSMGMLGMLGVAIAFMVGGWLLLGELPDAIASGDTAYYDALIRTVTYALLTVPIQLFIGLLLAYLLFHEVTVGKSFFRIVYFMPYIAPTVATAAVFAMVFSGRETSPMNQFMEALGLPVQQWLRNPKGVFQLIAEYVNGASIQLPAYLAGPSLPLLSAIAYSVWVFSGYNAVIFMAGLGNIPQEIYEAAQVDGAGRWAVFRRIIFPMISPTTFFLSLLAIVGTFRAFTHIWVLRSIDARGAMDTATVYIYENILTASVLKTRPYAAALSFLLFGIILILTVVQNRYSKDRVFYG